MRILSLPILLSLCLATHAAAAEGGAKPKTLGWASGKVSVSGNLATIDLPTGYRFLGQADAQYVVEQVWGNPHDDDVLGLVMEDKYEVDSDKGWAIIISYEKEGHVNDDDAAGLNYTDLLKQMQEGSQEANAERKKQGYPSVDLLGWAEPPHYDAATHKIYWAKKLQFEGSPKPTLNYNVRVLGREGVLVLNAVSDTDMITPVAAGSKAVLAKTELTSGNRYEDYKSGDHLAAYGIGGLIAGGVLLKTGLLKVLIKPLIIAGVVAVGFVKKLFGKKAA